jgi:general secretion pathway protein D
MRIVFPFRLSARVSAFLMVLSLAACAASTHHRAGMAAMDKGAYADAVTELQKASDLAPEDIQYRQDWLQNRDKATQRLLTAADNAMAQGKEADAATNYKLILKYDKANARALAGLGTIGLAARAAEDATQAREALKRGDLVQASSWVNRALQKMPEQAEARAVKGEIEAIQLRDTISIPSLSTIYKKPINLEFRDASVKMVFEALQSTTGINFIFDREVKGDQRTTVFLKQTSLEDAIDVILSTNQLEKKILNATSVLIYPNTPAKTKEYQDLMVKAFYMTNVEAKQAAGMLKTVLKLKDIFVDDKYNMLILRENAETIALAEKLIALHDMDEPEVMLEVEVLEVNRSNLLNLGVELSNQFTITPLNATTSAATDGSGTTTTTFKLSDLRHLNSDNLGITVPTATINIQKTDSDAKLLANPRLRVRDREKAKILIGDKVPVVTTTATPNGFLSENIQYLDVGLKLEVEPEIHLNDEIGLRISLEVSSLVSSIKTNNGSQAYQIGTRNLSSVLRLKDGETQVLAGLINDADRTDASRIPLLGDLPLLGRLFSSQKDDREKTEIVMSITPHLIRNIQRRDASAEAFWSGTEATLRTRSLQLRSIDASSGAAGAATPTGSSAPASAPVQPAVPNTSGIKLNWQGPAKAKVGEVVTLTLDIGSENALRAAPLQVAFDPTVFEMVTAKDGGYFNKDGKGNFNQVLDKASGRISVSAAADNGASVKGDGKFLTLELKALAPAGNAEVSVIGMTPVGATQAIGRPPLPAAHKIEITP